MHLPFEQLSDSLQAGGYLGQLKRDLRLLLIQITSRDLDQILADLIPHEVDLGLLVQHRGCGPLVIRLVGRQHSLKARADQSGKAQDFVARLLQRDRWHLDQIRVQVHHRPLRGRSRRDRLGLFRRRNHAFHQPGELSAEREKDQRVDHIEDGVGIRDLSRRLSGELGHAAECGLRRGHTHHQTGEWINEPDPEGNARQVEHNVHHTRAKRLPRLPQRCQECRYTSPHIRAKYQGNACRQTDQPLAGHRDHHARCCRRGLDQSGERRRHGNAERRVLHPHHQIQKGLIAAQRLHCSTHDTHAVEYQAESHHHCAILPNAILTANEQHTEADRDHQESQLRHLERNDLCGERSADVGTKYDSYGLGYGQYARCDEPDGQHRCYRRRLYDRRDHCTREGTHIAVGRQPGQNIFQPVSSQRLQCVGHLFHPK